MDRASRYQRLTVFQLGKEKHKTMSLKTNFLTGLALSLLISGLYISYAETMVDEGAIDGVLALVNTMMICVGILAGSIYQNVLDGSDFTSEIVFGWNNSLGGGHRCIEYLINAVGVSLSFILLALIISRVTVFNTSCIAILGLSMSGGIVWSLILDILRIKNYAIERIFRIIVTGSLLSGAILLWSTNI